MQPRAASNSGKKQGINPVQAISIANRELEGLMEAFASDASQSNMLAVIEKLRDSIVFFPGKQTEPGKFDMTPSMIRWSKEDGSEAKTFMAAFTSYEQVATGLIKEGTPIATLPFGAVCDLLLNYNKTAEKKIEGIMVNPKGKRFLVPEGFAERIFQLDKERRETGGERKPFYPAQGQPQMPVVENPEVDAIIEKMGQTEDPEEKNQLINQLYEKLWNAQTVVPSLMNEDKKLIPCIFEEKSSGSVITAVYTSGECMKMAPKEAVSVMMPFSEIVSRSLVVSRIMQEQEKVYGGLRVFSPKGHAVLFPAKMLERFVQVAERRKMAQENPNAAAPKTIGEQAAAQPKNIPMTPQMRAASEHVMFELRNLPNKLFEKGQELIDDIYARKELCLDELFEASYTNIREYPYLDEDFSVLAVAVREDMEVIRVDFPEQDQVAGCASRAYIVWDPKAQQSQYYAIVRQPGKDAKEHIFSVGPNDMIMDLGETVVEGSELSHITELADEYKNGENGAE